MTKISVRYHGWVALPMRLRQLLRLETGDELEAEVMGGELILRPARETSAAEAAAAALKTVAPASTGSKPAPKRGRPRKITVPVQSVKAGGRRKSEDVSSSRRRS